MKHQQPSPAETSGDGFEGTPMKILTHKQGSVEWLAARAGIPTASELGRLLTDSGAHRKGQMPLTYADLKAAEKWLGRPMPSFTSGAMEQGTLMEPEAIPTLAYRLGVDLTQPGLILTDDGRFGASPDALATEFGVEIKCPQPPAITGWIMDGCCPAEHWLQCQGGMFATGLPLWKFAAYRRDFPLFVVDVPRDDACQEAIAEAIDWLHTQIQDRIDAITSLNGGPRDLTQEDASIQDIF